MAVQLIEISRGFTRGNEEKLMPGIRTQDESDDLVRAAISELRREGVCQRSLSRERERYAWIAMRILTFIHFYF